MNAYAGLWDMKDSDNAHLGGNILEGDPLTYAPNVWNYIIKRFAIKSVLDLGSGIGHSSLYFNNEGLHVVAVDGMKENCINALYPTAHCDLSKSAFFTQVDLVHCQEVVEHIDEEFIDNLLSSLTCGKIIVMTHALPGQGGHHHVNEKPQSYWIDQLRRYNCELLIEDTTRIQNIALTDGAKYLANTGMVFSNKARFSRP